MEILTFLQEIQREPVNLARAALSFSQEISYPGLDIAAYLAQLDRLAEQFHQAYPQQMSPLRKAESLADYLFQELGFEGNTQDYDDPRNSYLNDVLERHLGIPISLSVLFLAVAERLGLPAEGVGLPGHFIVGIPGPDGVLYLDPFNHGQALTIIDCARLVELSTGYSGQFQNAWLQPFSPRAILARMLYNLRNTYIQQNKWRMALPVVEHLLLLQPDQPDHLRDLGTIYRQTGALRKAIACYQRYLAMAPEAADTELVKRNLQETARMLANLN
jgi:regulator of sirC expression with transglutaminase-like and TPR domain